MWILQSKKHQHDQKNYNKYDFKYYKIYENLSKTKHNFIFYKYNAHINQIQYYNLSKFNNVFIFQGL